MGELIFSCDKNEISTSSGFRGKNELCVHWYLFPWGFLKLFLEVFKIESNSCFFSAYLVELQLNIRLVEEVIYCSCIYLMVSSLTSFKKCGTSVRASKHKTIRAESFITNVEAKKCLFCNSEGNCSLKKSRQKSFRQSSYTLKRQYTPRTSTPSIEIPFRGLWKVLPFFFFFF